MCRYITVILFTLFPVNGSLGDARREAEYTVVWAVIVIDRQNWPGAPEIQLVK